MINARSERLQVPDPQLDVRDFLARFFATFCLLLGRGCMRSLCTRWGAFSLPERAENWALIRRFTDFVFWFGVQDRLVLFPERRRVADVGAVPIRVRAQLHHICGGQRRHRRARQPGQRHWAGGGDRHNHPGCD